MTSAESCPLGKLDKLLLATDLSEYSEGAVREAIRIARQCSSQLYVITVFEMNVEYETFGISITQELEKEAAKYFASVIKKAVGIELSCEAILCGRGEPYRLIVREAEKKRVDMIIIGRRGRGGLEKVLMGSTAAKVTGHAPCNVLLVPKAAQLQFRNILIATDGSGNASAAVSEALAIAKSCGSHVLVLSSYFLDNELEEAKSIVNKVIKMAQDEGVDFEALTTRGKPYDAIVETAGGRAVDLIVMGAYGKTGLRKFLMGSSTEKVVGLAGCAVLVVKHGPAG